MTTSTTSLMETTFRKTATGEQEVITRQHGLNAKERRVLILINGVQKTEQLAQLIVMSDLLAAISKLQSLDLIQSSTEPQSLQTPTQQATDTAIEFIQLKPKLSPSLLDEERLQAIKTLMIDSSESLLGLFARPLVEKIKSLQDESELSGAITQWHVTLLESKKGQQHAEHYLETIKTLMK